MKKLIISILALTATIASQGSEPNVQLAKLWWPDQRNVWTPIGWPDHYFKFTSLYNGMLIADPAPGFGPRPHSRKWSGQGFQLSFSPGAAAWPIPEINLSLWKIDGGHGIQGWDEERETPVLWTEYRCQEGIVFRTEVFAHITSNADTETALEPEYAWIRVKVVHVDPLRKPTSFPFTVLLTDTFAEHAEHYEYAVTIDAVPSRAPYRKVLKPVPYTDNGLVGYRVTEPDGKIRLEVLPSEEGRVSFVEAKKGIYKLILNFNAVEGEYIDLLLPMLPDRPEDAEAERSLTFDGALTMSDSYWKGLKPATAATFHVPETFLNDALKHSLRFSRVIAEMDYETKQYSYLTGIWGYDVLWTTPTSMVSHFLVDRMGYFDQTEKYSEIFIPNQGTVVPPGKDYYLHPGYFSTHKILTSIDWLSDHGAIMQQLSTHALLTDDKDFIEKWTGPLLKACDFIIDMSRLQISDGIPGLLPPAVATDDGIQMQAIWNIAWNYKGLCTTIRLLKRIGHPRAAEMEAFADSFKETFLREYRKTVSEGATWTDGQGRKRFHPSTVMTNRQPRQHPFTDAFYLDTGPMVLVWAGLMDADDPIMEDCADFFREGPNTALWEPMYHAIDRACLFHEMSSCEPCYSWNVFHSWQKADRYRYLEGMYSILVGAVSQNTYISCEHRHGVQGNLFAFPVAFQLARLSVVDDEIEPGRLHLLRLCPLAWITRDDPVTISSLPTEYGPVDLGFSLSDDGRTLNVTFSGKWHHAPSGIILHTPPVEGLEYISINGVRHNASEQDISL